MKWLYHFKKKWLDSNSSPLQGVYLRPIKLDEDKNELLGKIIDLNVIAVEFFINDNFKNVQEEVGLKEIYFNELQDKDYFIHEEKDDHDELYMDTATVYIKDSLVTPHSMLEWVKVFFNIKGLPFSEIQETHYQDFADTNPIARILSEGAKEMEDKLGKEWWKRKDRKN